MNIRDNPVEMQVVRAGYVFKGDDTHFLILGWETNDKAQVSRIWLRDLKSGHVRWCPPDHLRKAWVLVGKKFKGKLL